MESMPITTKVVSLNPAYGEVYLLQCYVIKLSVTCGRAVVFSTNKTDGYNITEILLKVVLNTINLEMIMCKWSAEE
jgi:hypothetical protein